MAHKVLVADDDFLAVVMLRDMLESQGYEVFEALNGQEAVSQAQTKTPDVMLLDIMMPLIDGKEVCRLLKRDPATRDLPIIMLTALSSSQDIKECFDAGAADYLIKPVEKSRLLKKLETTIKRQAFRMNLERRTPGHTGEHGDEPHAPVAEKQDARTRFRNSGLQSLAQIEEAVASFRMLLGRADGEVASEFEVRDLTAKLDEMAALCAVIHQGLFRPQK